jgi:hypothetical protein
MKYLKLFENYYDKNYRDIQQCLIEFKMNLSDYDISNISTDNEKTDNFIKKIIIENNSFWRGSKDKKNIEQVPPKEYNDIQLDGAEEITENGKYGLIFTTDSKEEAKSYGIPFKVCRKLNFNGNRIDWIKNNKFEPYDCSNMETEEDYNKFMTYLTNNIHAIIKVKRHNSTHYIFRGYPGEKLLIIINEIPKII